MTGHVGPEALERGTGDERREALEHLMACPSCRERLATQDPGRLFALLALVEPAPSDLEEVSRGVAVRMGPSRPSWLDAWRERGLPPSVPVAAAAALAALLVFFDGGRPSPGGSTVAALPVRADVRVTETAEAAHVVDLTVGDTHVVMVFDPGLEL